MREAANAFNLVDIVRACEILGKMYAADRGIRGGGSVSMSLEARRYIIIRYPTK
jgi:hypothetical protein